MVKLPIKCSKCGAENYYYGSCRGCTKQQTLRERCLAFHQKAQRDAILRQNDPVDELVNFVVSEIGRAADKLLGDSLPLCLYFTTEEDRKEFIAAVMEAKPNMISRK